MRRIYIAYHVPEEPRRQRVEEILNTYGSRQFSGLYYSELDRWKFQDLEREISAVLDKRNDNLRIFNICMDCRRNIDILAPVPTPH